MTLEEKIIQEVAKELGISQSIAQKIVRSQFQYVRKTMEKGEFETVKLPYFGKFHVKPYRLQKVNENYGTFYYRRKSGSDTTGTEISSSIQAIDSEGQGQTEESSVK
jgi:nucleoid DNA-binding protein